MPNNKHKKTLLFVAETSKASLSMCAHALSVFSKAGFKTHLLIEEPHQELIADHTHTAAITAKNIIEMAQQVDAVVLQFGGPVPFQYLANFYEAKLPLFGLDLNQLFHMLPEDRASSSDIVLQLDAISDGEECFIVGQFEEKPAEHTWLSPIRQLTKATIQTLEKKAMIIAKTLQIKGPFHLRWTLNPDPELINIHPYASARLPLLAEKTALPLIDIAINTMLNQSLKDQACLLPLNLPHEWTSKQLSPIEPLKSIKHPAKTKHLLTGKELDQTMLLNLLELAAAVKKNPKHYQQALQGKSLAMIFEKQSFRTRLSFHLAITQLGGHSIESVSQTRKTEEPRDLIRVLNGYCDYLMLRTHEDSQLEDMIPYATIPIINGLSALHHPCQILADLLSLQECFGKLSGLKLCYLGDGNNILHSLLLIAPKAGIDVHFCCPQGHEPNAQILAESTALYPNQIHRFDNPQEAVNEVHAIYTDVWTSMGFEKKGNEEQFQDVQVNEALMAYARSDAVFMHCMPMERGKEVSLTLPDSPQSIIFTQSENRLHVQKALLLSFM